LRARLATTERTGTHVSQKIFFIIFIDAMFTTLLDRLFTNSFDAARETPGAACM
jgi:hypothetical protein